MTFYIQHNSEQKIVDFSSIKDQTLEQVFSSIILQTSGNEGWDNVYLRWTNEPYSALDIDVSTPLREEEISYYAFRVNPSPSFYWRTHGGGMRFIYHDAHSFQAKELAILALGYMWRKWPQFSYEIKNDTRHPGYAKNGDLVTKPNSFRIEFNPTNYIESYVNLNRFDEEVINWLETNGYSLDERYPHSKCPYNPDETDSRKPVQIFNDGIFCFKCQGKGLKHVAKWGELLKKKDFNTLNLMLQNLTHWEQAEIILKKNIGNMPCLDLYYRTLVKLHLTTAYPDIDKTRMVQILRAVAHKGSYLLRYEGYWATADHRLPDNGQYLKKALEQLPIFLLKNDKSIILALTSDTIDFSQFGYPPITAVHGFPMHSIHIPEDKYLKVVDNYTTNKPTYIPEVTDQKVGKSWEVLEKVFPGINRNLIYLLICGKGITEYPYNIPHILYIWGVTSAAKTSSVKIAGAIVGSSPSEFAWQKDEHYLGTKFLNGCRNSSFILINEVAKSQVSYNFLLSLDSNAMVHQLHHGPTKLGRLPFIVLTDIVIAESLQNSAQYRRRMHFVQLNESVNWFDTMHEHNLTSISELRERFPNECNTILSYCIDRFFNKKRTFHSIFTELGFAAEQEEMEYINPIEKTNDMYNFFLAFCKTCKPVSGADKQRWKGRDTRLFSYVENSLVSDLWREYTGPDPKNFQVFLEQDWKKILNVSEPVQLIICRFNGAKTGIRFVSKTNELVNQEIIGEERFREDLERIGLK